MVERSVDGAERRRGEDSTDSSETDHERGVHSALGLRAHVVGLVREDGGNVGLLETEELALNERANWEGVQHP